MDTKKKVVNQQPQKEEKKQNKLVAWWLGLGRWAKVGLCAGTAAVLATAITLPIVLTNQNKGGAGETNFDLVKSQKNDNYETKKFNLKKNVEYTFNLKFEESVGINTFLAYKESDPVSSKCIFKNAPTITGTKELTDWYLTQDKTSYTGQTNVTKGDSFVIKATFENDMNDAIAIIATGGE